MPSGRGPRPLRSACNTWGLEGLSRREYSQLSIGNTILRCAAELSVESARHGVSGLVEHRDCPRDVGLPSIWRLGVFIRLAAHPDVHQFSFRQGALGQASPKPTRLHTTNLPKSLAYIKSLSSDHFKPRPVELGKIEDNCLFATAKLKTYPPRLNGANVMSFIDCFARLMSAILMLLENKVSATSSTVLSA